MFDKRIIYFMSVVEEGSFSAAGRKLYLSQSAISQDIKTLENELSISLFDRKGYRPVLTEAGRIYYNRCLDLFMEYNRLCKDLKESYGHTLKIGFTGSYENKDILSLVGLFKRKVKCDVTFVEGSFEDCVRFLYEGKTDVSFGLESDFVKRSELVFHPLFEYEIVVICAFDHPLAKYDEIDVSKLKKEQFIVLSSSFGKGFYHDFMDAFKKDGFKPHIKKKVDSFDELVFYVSVNEGISIVSSEVVRESDVKKIRLLNSHHQSFYAVGYKKELNNELVKQFIEETKKYFNSIS